MEILNKKEFNNKTALYKGGFKSEKDYLLFFLFAVFFFAFFFLAILALFIRILRNLDENYFLASGRTARLNNSSH
ncbi:hypothetical protein A2999_00810 [Candidatus Wolfebacteria bacterium RIFCSPLOWO2_01_FULL_38_11]|uniref:Uncharacterized protein n=1 Tax=Candidatus Wolfebacteria bacterium RIFCSPLOWO2_01_FULL_38_11 TaxID=1802556 RepID=A0A1F8DPC3_9BACT|nr:MAG: hypothetical protein A2999_00810 [Candidatus Wolfebacteria bacterium RIFCSPLOWO2_01_FULL_38_11]